MNETRLKQWRLIQNSIKKKPILISLRSFGLKT